MLQCSNIIQHLCGLILGDLGGRSPPVRPASPLPGPVEGVGPLQTTLSGSFSPSCPAWPKVLCLSPEVTKTTLLEEMRTTMVAKSRVLELEEKVQLLTGQQESLGQELSTTTTQLEKEKAKVESMLRHEEVWPGVLSPCSAAPQRAVGAG